VRPDVRFRKASGSRPGRPDRRTVPEARPCGEPVSPQCGAHRDRRARVLVTRIGRRGPSPRPEAIARPEVVPPAGPGDCRAGSGRVGASLPAPL